MPLSKNPIHIALMRLHTERRRLLFQLEAAVQRDNATEDINIALSENRGAAREFLKFLSDEVATLPVDLDGPLPQTSLEALWRSRSTDR